MKNENKGKLKSASPMKWIISYCPSFFKKPKVGITFILKKLNIGFGRLGKGFIAGSLKTRDKPSVSKVAFHLVFHFSSMLRVMIST
ncbi:hypothetical protein E2P63_04315 [Candidatus Bathyarchaeota archaeon]|nr:hypothetical protein E2P63_04315 [Candidatus Bathyarchaeota archaeon]